MKLHIFKSRDELASQLAQWISNLVNSTLQEQEYFTLVLSGGETPKILFKILASDYTDKIDWKRVQIFWADERAVPFKDERNNAKVAFDILIDKIDIPSSQVHIMRTDIEPVFAAKEYDKKLHDYFNHTEKSFDLVLLGMGDDGHTLSLFPNSSILEDENDNWVNSVYNEAQQMYRITLMPLIVNRASHIAFMVDGDKKAKSLKQVIEGAYNPIEFPAQLIKPANGELHWFLDEAAAKNLSDSK